MSSPNKYRKVYREDARALGLNYGDTHPLTGKVWTGGQYVSPEGYEKLKRRNLVNMAKNRCKRTGREFRLTVEDVDRMWPADGRCPVFPWIVLKWGEYESGDSPSIDRVDGSKGYTPDNCRVISWRANRLKSDATPKELQRLLAYTAQHPT